MFSSLSSLLSLNSSLFHVGCIFSLYVVTRWVSEDTSLQSSGAVSEGENVCFLCSSLRSLHIVLTGSYWVQFMLNYSKGNALLLGQRQPNSTVSISIWLYSRTFSAWPEHGTWVNIMVYCLYLPSGLKYLFPSFLKGLFIFRHQLCKKCQWLWRAAL